MFTGLVDHTGELLERVTQGGGVVLCVATDFTGIELGESIAVNGICLSVIETEPGWFKVEVSPETLDRTTARFWQKGVLLNCERALALGDRVGGHFVTGHIDQTAQCDQITELGDYTQLTFSGVAQSNMPLLHEKGSVAVNGVSLTVNAVLETGFDVMIIPHTWERTQLSALSTGHAINIEFDTMAKMVQRQLQCVNQTI